MTPPQDPYRVLGLVPGATAGEIRSAYRRLAKLHHPDKAGERSLPRFLAIQAAYEELVDGEGRLRGRGWPGRTGSSAPRPSAPPRPAPPSGPSSAHRASREGWRARQAGSAKGDEPAAGSAGDGGGSRPGGRGDGDRTRGRRRERSSGWGPSAGSTARGGGQRGTGQGRPERRTARPGSTTYDEAAQPLDPSWEGGSWYGASSGRYWTLNPREYADPRKHGPEYQERARRAARLDGVEAPNGRPSVPPPAARASEPASPASGQDGIRPDGAADGGGRTGGQAPRQPQRRLVWRSRRRRAP